jgi:Methyltransferase domain
MNEHAESQHAAADSAACFRAIDRLPGAFLRGGHDLFQLLGGVSARPDAPVLELGVFCGRSLSSLACAFPAARVVGVDPFFEDFHESPALPGRAERLTAKVAGMSPEDRFRLMHDVWAELGGLGVPGLPQRVELQRTTQDEFFASKPAEEKYQLIHADAEHTFAAIKSCLDRLDDLLLPGGLLVLDDFSNPGFPDISEAVYVHSGFRVTYDPVLYAWNKGVFLYRASDGQLAQLRRTAQDAYASTFVTRRLHDGSVVVESRFVPRRKSRRRAVLEALGGRRVYRLLRRIVGA